MRLPLSLTLFLPLISATIPESVQIPLNPSKINMEPQLSNGSPSLADLLTIEPSVSIFYSYARELALSALFSEEPSQFSQQSWAHSVQGGLTLLVPTNKAVMALARKPHQGPAPKEGQEPVLTEEEFERSTKENIERWVQAHIIPNFPLDFPSQKTYDTLLEGKSVSFVTQKSEEAVSVQDGESTIQISGTKMASNGVLYIIDGTINTD
ncbi:hypothetical protein D9757_013927 [Collybiopsis confluens]|uniref:FAS1 domain-containing protein n=1 Tax=Collybiopsis confluens TaxID=2823264 RepID=A0A8H5FPX0_9AGAR|nr:hypothetical protein D9757_013927 [Collybiopsis confluens]